MALNLPTIMILALWPAGPARATGGMLVKEGTFDSNAVTGNQSVTGVGFQPKAFIFFAAHANATGFQNQNRRMIGFATSSTSRASVGAGNNTSTTQTGQRIDNTKAITVVGNNGTVNMAADLVSMDNDGFTINITTINNDSSKFATDLWISYLALGGTDITNATVGSFAMSTSAGNQSITGVGFKPDAIITAWSQLATIPSASGAQYLGIGAASSASNQAAMYAGSGNTSPTTDQQAQLTDSVVVAPSGSSQKASLSSFDSDGFSLNWAAGAGSAYQVVYLALQGGNYHVGNDTQQVTTTGTKATTGVGFKPAGLLLFGDNNAASTGVDTSNLRTSVGATDGTNQSTIWASTLDNSTTPTAQQRTSTSTVFQTAALSSQLTSEASLSSFDSDGFTLNWTTVTDSVTRQFIYLAVGSSSSATTTQAAYKFFANSNSTDVGSQLAGINTPTTAPTQGTPFRLRVLLNFSGGSAINAASLKLQVAAQAGSCDTGFVGESYTDVSPTSGNIRYYDNSTPADGAALTANAGDPTDGANTVVTETYEEANNFTDSQTAIGSGQDGEWDFSLVDFSSPASTAYCFRVVSSTGTVLDTYSAIPQITTAGAAGPTTDQLLRGGTWWSGGSKQPYYWAN